MYNVGLTPFNLYTVPVAIIIYAWHYIYMDRDGSGKGTTSLTL